MACGHLTYGGSELVDITQRLLGRRRHHEAPQSHIAIEILSADPYVHTLGRVGLHGHDIRQNIPRWSRRGRRRLQRLKGRGLATVVCLSNESPVWMRKPVDKFGSVLDAFGQAAALTPAAVRHGGPRQNG